MGVVSVRRRQGRPFLLDSLARAAHGSCFRACEATGAESLRRFGEGLGPYRGSPAPMRCDRWEQAVGALLGPGGATGDRVMGTGRLERLCHGERPPVRHGGGPDASSGSGPLPW
ncbi:hypothetical protein AB0A94_04790 [Streptomyces sp. NPDC044984]|uniref:hypothetical protein n=1 Tax=Streptomyces sp. NPDC044984 TaxID=3154335 RepID=UPI0033D11D60